MSRATEACVGVAAQYLVLCVYTAQTVLWSSVAEQKLPFSLMPEMLVGLLITTSRLSFFV